jgi:hypothetical protein
MSLPKKKNKSYYSKNKKIVLKDAIKSLFLEKEIAKEKFLSSSFINKTKSEMKEAKKSFDDLMELHKRLIAVYDDFLKKKQDNPEF